MGHLYRLNKYHNCAVGSHTAVRVAGEISKVFWEYSIKNKVHYAVTDNASNMNAAFNVSFNLSDDTSSDDVNSEDEEEAEPWEDMADVDTIIVMVDLGGTARLSCFAHTLQLTVGDAMKLAACLNSVITRVKSISTLLHQSSAMKVCLYLVRSCFQVSRRKTTPNC